jgi:hypothetical protein
LKYHDFEKTAEPIFHSCKKLLKAGCGYIALLKNNGTENDVLFLDTGSHCCAVEPSLDMPIRGNKKPKFHVSACLGENEWVFSVQYNGIGIDTRDAERIFIIFQRLHVPEQASVWRSASALLNVMEDVSGLNHNPAGDRRFISP